MADPASTRRTVRRQLGNVIFETNPGWPVRFDAILLVIIALSVTAVCLESVESVRSRYGDALAIAEWVFTGLFTVEFAARLWTAHHRRRYLFSFFGIVDVLSLLPTYLSLVLVGGHSLIILRILRLLRIFRVLKVVRMSREATHLLVALRASAPKVTVFVGTVLIIAVIVGAIMHSIEGAENGFTSIPAGVYWAIVTLTTVGYGDIAPGTPLGQSLAAILMILGYGIIAVPTGIVSAEIISARKVRRICKVCPVTDHALDATFCRSCGSVLEFEMLQREG